MSFAFLNSTALACTRVAAHLLVRLACVVSLQHAVSCVPCCFWWCNGVAYATCKALCSNVQHTRASPAMAACTAPAAQSTTTSGPAAAAAHSFVGAHHSLLLESRSSFWGPNGSHARPCGRSACGPFWCVATKYFVMWNADPYSYVLSVLISEGCPCNL